MDRLGQEQHAEWMSWGDAIVVVTALLLGLLGIVRHIKADDALLTALRVPDEAAPLSSAPAAAPDLAVETPDFCPPACDPRIMHVLDPWGEDPLWSGRTEALLLWRDNPQGLGLFNNAPSAGGGSALNAADFGSGMAAGPRFTLFRHTGDQGAIEFNYLRVQSFTASEQLPTTSGGYRETTHGIFCCPSNTPLNTAGGTLASSLQSFELNRRFPTDGGWQWLTGFRWVQWNEQLDLSSTTIGNDIDRYATDTFNDLYGWQAGADSILLGLGGPWRLEGLGKAGVYYNQAAQRSAWSTTDGGISPQSLAVGTDVGRVAFVGELGLTGVYDITDWLSVRAGYAIFWLGGIATAPNQLDAQVLCPTEAVRGATDTAGSVVVQGITLGLEGRW